MSTEPEFVLPRSVRGALVHPWTWRMAWRDSRTQRKRLVVFSLSIVLGISALVAIHALKASAQRAIGVQAKALLGSDLQITSRRPFPDSDLARLALESKRISQDVTLASMVYFSTADAARLVDVHGLEGDFPFYGSVETSPPGAWEKLRSETGLLVEPALLDQFHAKIGDKVRLGSLELPILGSMIKPPPRSSRFGGFSPAAYLALSSLRQTGLLGRSSLVSYNLELELAEPAAAARIREQFSDTALRFETPDDRRNTLGNALDDFQQFLGIIALAALVLGAIGVAGAIHAHVSRRIPTIAVLRCLGCPANLAFAVYLAQAAALGSIGAGSGAALGVAFHLLAVSLFRNSLPIALDGSPPWKAVVETTVAGLAVCAAFALLPLLRVRSVSPMAMLRESASPAVGPRSRLRGWPLYLLIAGLLVLVSALDSRHWLRALAITGGLGAAFLLLAGTAKALVFLARQVVRPAWPYLLRQGVSNLHRPHNQTLLFLLSLGLGTFLLLTVLLAKNLLLREFSPRSFADSPTIYLVDVQPDQLEGVSALVRSEKLPLLETAPMVTMRIRSVRGVSVRELEKQHAIPKWALQREFRSSYRDRLSATETVVAGRWVAKAADLNGPAPLSLEEDIAKDLRVSVGDVIGLDVQGVPLEARVVNLRRVDWSRFSLNFFMIFPPGVLESAPGFDVVTTRVPSGASSGDLQRLLVKRYPNVSTIDLTQILDTVHSIVEKISRIVSVLAGVTVLAGLPILVGTLLNARDQRLRESVLLRTLGASARQVRIILLVEYAVLGALSACAGVVLAIAANIGLARWVFNGSPWPDPWLLAAAFLSATLIAILAGLASSQGISNHPPLAILRGIG